MRVARLEPRFDAPLSSAREGSAQIDRSRGGAMKGVAALMATSMLVGPGAPKRPEARAPERFLTPLYDHPPAVRRR